MAERLDIGEAEALARLQALLADAVGRRTIADVPLGAFLSGGIDSSLIVALMQQRCSRPVNTFAVGFAEKRYDEASYARAVARHLGTDHTDVRVTASDALALVPELPHWFDEPFAIRSQIPAMMVSRLARRKVTVALSGDGGDELFGGYPGYRIVRAVHAATGGLPPMLRRLVAGGVDGLAAGITALHGLLPVAHRPGLLANRVRQLSGVLRRGGGIDAYYAELYSAAAARPPLAAGGGEHPMRWQDPLHRDVVADPLDRMGYFALLGTLVDGTLAKWDRASMACSLEVRVPFLDHRVVELAWRLPPALKYCDRSGSKHLLRQLLYRHVPAELVDRPKKGFSSPLPVWLRGPLRDWAEGLLDARELEAEGIFDPVAVRACWHEHLEAGSDHWQLLWSVLTFRQWHRHWHAVPAVRRERSVAVAAGPVPATAARSGPVGAEIAARPGR